MSMQNVKLAQIRLLYTAKENKHGESTLLTQNIWASTSLLCSFNNLIVIVNGRAGIVKKCEPKSVKATRL